VRQHVLAEQFQRFHQLVRMFRARGLERQIDDADADLFAALLQLRDDLIRPAAEIDRQHRTRLFFYMFAVPATWIPTVVTIAFTGIGYTDLLLRPG
jgi:hypothetical protein